MKSNQERRQANRLIRAARDVERRLFELIDELQLARLDDEDYDWQSCLTQLQMVQSDLPILLDLARSIKREKADARDLGGEG